MDFELVSLVLAVLSWNKRSKGVTPPRWWLVTVVTLSVNRGPESSSIVLYCGIPIRVRSVVVVRLLCWEYTLIKLRLLVLVISTNGYNSYFNIGAKWEMLTMGWHQTGNEINKRGNSNKLVVNRDLHNMSGWLYRINYSNQNYPEINMSIYNSKSENYVAIPR